MAGVAADRPIHGPARAREGGRTPELCGLDPFDRAALRRKQPAAWIELALTGDGVVEDRRARAVELGRRPVARVEAALAALVAFVDVVIARGRKPRRGRVELVLDAGVGGDRVPAVAPPSADGTRAIELDPG